MSRSTLTLVLLAMLTYPRYVNAASSNNDLAKLPLSQFSTMLPRVFVWCVSVAVASGIIPILRLLLVALRFRVALRVAANITGYASSRRFRHVRVKHELLQEGLAAIVRIARSTGMCRKTRQVDSAAAGSGSG